MKKNNNEGIMCKNMVITIYNNIYIPYTPKTNPVEGYYNQVKHYLKLNKKVLRFDDLKKEVKKAIKSIKKENYKNYFLYAYKKEKLRKPNSKNSTLKRKLKTYK